MRSSYHCDTHRRDVLVFLAVICGVATGFQTPSSWGRTTIHTQRASSYASNFIPRKQSSPHHKLLWMSSSLEDNKQELDKSIRAAPVEERKIVSLDQTTLSSSPKKDGTKHNKNANDENDLSGKEAAAVSTINERLMQELKEAEERSSLSGSSEVSKKLGLDALKRPKKTDEEREAALALARDLNGVNPLVAFGGSVFALAACAGLWFFTRYLAELFALHPVPEDSIYIVQRLAAVFRNVVMGISSLASGFFGVTGLGILLLSIRVAYGVSKGELDPTPIVKKNNWLAGEAGGDWELPNAWDLMTGKKPGRRGRK